MENYETYGLLCRNNNKSIKHTSLNIICKNKQQFVNKIEINVSIDINTTYKTFNMLI